MIIVYHYLFVQLQLSSAAQLYTTNYMNKGSVAAYHLYLKIREILSLSSGIPERYVCMVQ